LPKTKFWITYCNFVIDSLYYQEKVVLVNKNHSAMNWKKTLGEVVIVAVGVLVANQVQQMLDKARTSAPSAE
jgi:hypothetical protein